MIMAFEHLRSLDFPHQAAAATAVDAFDRWSYRVASRCVLENRGILVPQQSDHLCRAALRGMWVNGGTGLHTVCSLVDNLFLDDLDLGGGLGLQQAFGSCFI